MSHTSVLRTTTSPSASPSTPRVRLGLVCINNTLREQGVYCNRTCIRRTYSVEKAKQLATANLEDLFKVLQWNQAHNIRHYRLSSDMFPHFTDDAIERYDYTLDMKVALRMAGGFAKAHNHRITMHPGQYNVVGTPNKAAFERTVDDLTHHAYILDMMGIGPEGILCVHGGGVYGDKEAATRRWIEQFDDLPSSVKRRIAIENCEHSYNVEDCLTIAEACKIPVIYDTHHHKCWCQTHSIEDSPDMTECMPRILETWDHHGCSPLFHISDQAEGKQLGAHHDYVSEIPQELLSIPAEYDRNVDIEVEAKAKEAAIFRLYKQHPEVFA